MSKENQGQGSTEYLLLLGAMLIIAVLGISIYYSYFNPTNSTPVTVEITNPGKSTVNVMYEVRSSNVPSRVNSSASPTQYFVPDGKEQEKWTQIKPGETIKFTLPGSLKAGLVVYLEVGVSGKRSVTVKITQGDEKESFTVTGPFTPSTSKDINKYLKSGSVIKAISIKEGDGVNSTVDMGTVRGEV